MSYLNKDENTFSSLNCVAASSYEVNTFKKDHQDQIEEIASFTLHLFYGATHIFVYFQIGAKLVANRPII